MSRFCFVGVCFSYEDVASRLPAVTTDFLWLRWPLSMRKCSATRKFYAHASGSFQRKSCARVPEQRLFSPTARMTRVVGCTPRIRIDREASAPRPVVRGCRCQHASHVMRCVTPGARGPQVQPPIASADAAVHRGPIVRCRAHELVQGVTPTPDEAPEQAARGPARCSSAD